MYSPTKLLLATVLMATAVATAIADDDSNYDYFSANRQLIRNGVQAVLTCNGLYTSRRSIEQVFDQELAYLGDRVLGDATKGSYQVHPKDRAVSVGGAADGPTVSAAFREGVGCVVMAPDMSLDDIDTLPKISLPYSGVAATDIDWPVGDRAATINPGKAVDLAALQAASEWAFNRQTEEQDTISLIVVHNGKIIHERYAPGFDHTTRTRTWSTAKSIAATLIGMRVDDGELALDKPLGESWLPEIEGAARDPRDAITLRQVLNMSSGLYPVDSNGMEYATGSGLSYWAGASSLEGMRDRGLVREPGTHWDYENYDTLLAVHALKRSLPDADSYLAFPRTQLFDKLGMRNTLVSTDRFGDFIFSSQMYTNARDLARFGLLYLNEGNWLGEQLISKAWINFSRTPAPASDVRGHDYGGQWWLVPDDRKEEVPANAYSTAGNRGQYVIVVPSHDLVIVRRGLDFGGQGFDRWDLLREVLAAF